MNRREFSKLAIMAGMATLVGGCRSRDELRVLENFLEPDEGMKRSEIENILYDISSVEGFTRGRAVSIGDNFFLSAYHVVKGNGLVLLPQHRRGYLIDYRQDFDVVFYDETSDIALLKTEDMRIDGNPNVHLTDEVIIGDDVSTFMRLVGNPSNNDYDFSFDGKDYYDDSKDAEDIGRLILPEGSLLYEKQGKVLELDKEFFNEIDGSFFPDFEHNLFTSICSYNGESGGPVFTNDNGNYGFAGIITGGYGIKHDIETPGNPLGIRLMQQTGAFFTGHEGIEKLIRGYIEEVKAAR